MLAYLLEAYPSPVRKKILFDQMRGDDALEESRFYQVRTELRNALRPHGLVLEKPRRYGTRLEIFHEQSKSLVAPSDPIREAGYPSKITAFRTWERAQDLVSKAQRTVVIIDGFFSEHCELDLCVAKAIEARQKMSEKTAQESNGKKLEITVYMTSPDTAYGAQRVREMERPDEDNAKCIGLLKQDISLGEREDYRKEFKLYVRRLGHIAKKRPIELRIYKYVATPSTRMIIVDDRHFVFGWFPLWEQNPGYICMYLEDRGLQGADLEVVGKLRDQVKNFHAISRLIFPNRRKVRKKTG
jgi:hypothetical protein